MTEIDWAGLLVEENVEELWNGLYHMVSRHPAVRPLHFATDGAAVASHVEINADLAQELFLELFQKQRFEHYSDNHYTSTEIENEIAHIEVPNLVGARLRKRYPESFRLARRVSSLLKTSPRFHRLGADAQSEPTEQQAKPARRRGRPPGPAKAKLVAEQSASLAENLDDNETDVELIADAFEEENSQSKKNGNNGTGRRRRMVNQVFGLKEWTASKPIGDSGHFSDLIKSVPMRKRDTRFVGRSGSSQLILSNPDLEALIVEVFNAIDSPADVRTVRQLVLSKIPLQDYNVASLDEELSSASNGAGLRRDAPDTRATPEDALLRKEENERIALMADDFLDRLRRAVNNNERRFARLLSTLYHCYYDPQSPSQLEIAKLLGVSDSLVSDNRRLIEYELKKLRLTVDDGAVFSESLQRLVQGTTSALSA